MNKLLIAFPTLIISYKIIDYLDCRFKIKEYILEKIKYSFILNTIIFAVIFYTLWLADNKFYDNIFLSSIVVGLGFSTLRLAHRK